MLLSNTVHISVRYLLVLKKSFEKWKKNYFRLQKHLTILYNITLERNIYINLLIRISEMILDLYTYSSNMDTGFQPSALLSVLLQWKKCSFFMIFHEIHYHIIIVYISLNCLLMILFFTSLFGFSKQVNPS